MKRNFGVAVAIFLVVSLLGTSRVVAAPPHNTAFGAGSLPGGTGDFNSAFGFSALHTNTSGAGNTATGFNALFSNTAGGDNTATGQSSLLSNTTGSSNTATGADALQNNTGATTIPPPEFSALQGNDTGSENTAAGVNALQSNTTGFGNTATGSNALLSNTTGGGNTAAGMEALKFNTTGADNVAIGRANPVQQYHGQQQHRHRSQCARREHLRQPKCRHRSGRPVQQHHGTGNTATGCWRPRAQHCGRVTIQPPEQQAPSKTTPPASTIPRAEQARLVSNTTGFTNTAIGAGALDLQHQRRREYRHRGGRPVRQHHGLHQHRDRI